jgi:hypothetical protein
MMLTRRIAAGLLAGLIGSAFLTSSTRAYSQVDGAVQYPPAAVGADAQPPPPARMVPPVVSPRRYEFRFSGSSQWPGAYPSGLPSWTQSEGRRGSALGLVPTLSSGNGY